MQTEEFRACLENAGYDTRTIYSRIRNCLTICRSEGDIDEHYDEDECAELLRRFTYTTADERAGRPARHNVPINGNIKKGTATLKTALKLYISFRNGGVHVNEIANGAQAIPRNRRGHGNGRVINCLEGLIELIIGTDNAELPKAEKLKMLARHMVQKSYFMNPESVNCRHQEILELIRNNDKLPARFSTAESSYTEENGEDVQFENERVGHRASVHRKIMYKCFRRSVPVIIDKDGNYEIRRIIKRFSGAKVSQGEVNNVLFAIISHIWGNAFNPLCFSNLWNIVIVPDYVNSILDKSEKDHPSNFFEEAVNYVKAYYKELCYKMYNMEAKVEEYEQLGFHVRPFFAAAAASNIEDNVIIKELNFLEDQGF